MPGNSQAVSALVRCNLYFLTIEHAITKTRRKKTGANGNVNVTS